MEFDAVLDDHNTDLCRSLDRVVVPIGHPYLETYYPPTHFGCRSTVRQLTHGKETNLDEIIFPDIPKIFQTNLAENGLLYPKDHPYFNGYKQGYNLPLLQKEVKDFAIIKYTNKSINVAGLGDVLITKQGIKKGISTYASGEDAEFEIQLHNVLPSLI